MSEILGTVLGGAMQLGLGAINNQWAKERADRDRRQNYMYGEMTANAADKRTRALYNDFYSPEALMKQYQEAGLSPSMMYGGTPGQSGMSGAQGSGAAGLQTPYMPISMIEGAQAAKLLAETQKTKAETEQIKPTAEADIAAKLAEAGYKEASATYTKMLSEYQEIVNKYAGEKAEANLKLVAAQTEHTANMATKAFWEACHEKTLAEIDEKSMQEQIDNWKLQNQNLIEQNKNLIKDILVKNTQIKLNNTQAEALVKDIENRTQETYIKWSENNREWVKTLNLEQLQKKQEEFMNNQIEQMWKELEFKYFSKNIDQELALKQLQETIRHNMIVESNQMLIGIFGAGMMLK